MNEEAVFKDKRGAKLEIGDTVIYFKTGRYPVAYVARVVSFKKKIRIGSFDMMNGRTWQQKEDDEEIWVDWSSLVKVLDLPQVEGRLNT